MDALQRFLRQLPGPWGNVAEPDIPRTTLSMVSGIPPLEVGSTYRSPRSKACNVYTIGQIGQSKMLQEYLMRTGKEL
jgi:hypothetical protein